MGYYGLLWVTMGYYEEKVNVYTFPIIETHFNSF